MAKLNLRRLRNNPLTRELVSEIQISPTRLIQPLFVVDGIKTREAIPGLTNVYRETPSTLLTQVEADLEKGTNKVLLFGVPKEKHEHNFNFDFTSKQIFELKKRFGKDIWLSVDVCLCSSTTHGQCGVVTKEGDIVDNEKTVEALAKAALAYANAGADCTAPSDMMDGRVGSIRKILDENNLNQTLIMSYSAKFSSGFYGPFRGAADSSPKGDIKLKDRKTYQIDPRSPKDALLSSLRDANEGADILMVKPGLPYLDILYRLSKEIQKPWAVYEVSGEYAAIELMAKEGLMNRAEAHLEV